MAGIYLRVAVLALFTCSHVVTQQGPTCPQGHRVHTPSTGPDVCVPCQDGVTFTSEALHTHRKCRDCTKVDNPDLEMVVAYCNRTHDTDILCRAGYYRYKVRNVREKDRCDKCRECEYPARPCEGYHDTVCCPAGLDSILVEGVIVCKEPSVACEQGNGACQGDHAGGPFDKEPDKSLPTRAVTEASQQVSQQQGGEISEENKRVCLEGFYLHTNLSDGISTCKPCDSPTQVNNSTKTSDLHLTNCNTNTTVASKVYTETRVVSIVLFTLAVLVDVFYVLLFSHNFINRSPGRLSRSSSSDAEEKVSRMIGTVGIDLHVVLVCVHSFGLLCEVSLVTVSEDTMCTFTVVVSVLSLVVYFLDALLFVLVKRLFCVTSCFLGGPHSINDNDDVSSEHTQAFLDST